MPNLQWWRERITFEICFSSKVEGTVYIESAICLQLVSGGDRYVHDEGSKKNQIGTLNVSTSTITFGRMTHVGLFLENEEIDVDSLRHELTEGAPRLTIRGQHLSMQRQCHKRLNTGITPRPGHFAEISRIDPNRSPDLQEPVE